MINRIRSHWSQEIDDVIRSKHYTWLARGLGGEAVEDAMVSLTTDIMHICRRKGIPWQQVLAKSQAQFEMEEVESSN